MKPTHPGSDGSTEGAGTVGGAAPVVRYRCTACGNLTRFDVVSTRRTQAYHHYALSGELAVEDEQVLAETVEEVTCRWCGRGTAVERVAAGQPWGPSGPLSGEPGPSGPLSGEPGPSGPLSGENGVSR